MKSASNKPRIPQGLHKFFLKLLFGYTITDWTHFTLKQRGKKIWVPLRDINYKHPYQKMKLDRIEKNKQRVEEAVKEITKVDLNKFYFDRYPTGH